LVAIRQLGQFYSHRVRVQSEHKIISQGPYRFVRHPAYTGMILSHLGFSLFFFNTWTLGFWALIHVPAVVYRILVEEKALFQIKGYPEYARNRKRIIPLLW
jgi:protein-S-isoprenylcysteine O-methyltransferase Ste14